MGNIALRLCRIARFLLAGYGHTLWVSPKGKVYELSSQTHGDWMAENWEEFFPDVEFSPRIVFSHPHEVGWIRIRNHAQGFGGGIIKVVGNKQQVKRHSRIIRDIIDEGFPSPGESVYVDFAFTPKSRDLSIEIPEEEDKLEQVL